MAETVISIAPNKTNARYVFSDEAEARRLLDMLLDNCENKDEVLHSIYEYPSGQKRCPEAFGEA